MSFSKKEEEMEEMAIISPPNNPEYGEIEDEKIPLTEKELWGWYTYSFAVCLFNLIPL